MDQDENRSPFPLVLAQDHHEAPSGETGPSDEEFGRYLRAKGVQITRQAAGPGGS